MLFVWVRSSEEHFLGGQLGAAKDEKEKERGEEKFKKNVETFYKVRPKQRLMISPCLLVAQDVLLL